MICKDGRIMGKDAADGGGVCGTVLGTTQANLLLPIRWPDKGDDSADFRYIELLLFCHASAAFDGVGWDSSH